MSDDANKDIMKAINNANKNKKPTDDSVVFPAPQCIKHSLEIKGGDNTPILGSNENTGEKK